MKNLRQRPNENLELKRLKLLNKAFKMMPNSLKQLKVRKEIADLKKTQNENNESTSDSKN